MFQSKSKETLSSGDLGKEHAVRFTARLRAQVQVHSKTKEILPDAE